MHQAVCPDATRQTQNPAGLQKSIIWAVHMCVSNDSTYAACLHPQPQSPTHARRPTRQWRAHPQSTVTKGKSWAQDIRPPLAARVRPAQSFLQSTAVWAKPPLLSAHYRRDLGGWGRHQQMQWPEWSWGLVFGEVGVTMKLYSWVDMISILFFPPQTMCDLYSQP